MSYLGQVLKFIRAYGEQVSISSNTSERDPETGGKLGGGKVKFYMAAIDRDSEASKADGEEGSAIKEYFNLCD